MKWCLGVRKGVIYCYLSMHEEGMDPGDVVTLLVDVAVSFSGIRLCRSRSEDFKAEREAGQSFHSSGLL